jgi:hypothetical protein
MKSRLSLSSCGHSGCQAMTPLLIFCHIKGMARIKLGNQGKAQEEEGQDGEPEDDLAEEDLAEEDLVPPPIILEEEMGMGRPEGRGLMAAGNGGMAATEGERCKEEKCGGNGEHSRKGNCKEG